MLVLCGGPPKPFEGWGQPAKHLIEVEGEQVVARTVRQARKYTSDVHVIRPACDDRYEIPGAWAQDERLDHPLSRVSNMFWPSRHLWALRGRTVLLLGDVWFSDDAMLTIMQNRDDIGVFGRMEASKVTGCGYGEIWAFAFDHTQYDNMDLAIAGVAKTRALYGGGSMTGWEVRDALGASTWIEIDDFTEDFDSAEDVRKWKEARDAHNHGDILAARAPLGVPELRPDGRNA